MQRIADNYGEWVGTCQSYIQRRDALSARLGEFGTVQVQAVDPAVILGAAEEIAPGGDCVQTPGHRTG